MRFILFFLITPFIQTFVVDHVVFVIFTQGTTYYLKGAKNLKNSINEQGKHLKLQNYDIVIKSTQHQKENWVIFPMFSKLIWEYPNSSWFVILEERTGVNLENLLNVLKKYDRTQKLWVGKSLTDKEPTIIHHFKNPKEFEYPHIGCGFAMTLPLLQGIVQKLQTKKLHENDFYIDKAYELSLLIKRENKETKLINDKHFCLVNQKHCATYLKPFKPCNDIAPINSIYFAVKTCEKFHKSRLNVVINTWGQKAKFIEFFSDVEDKMIPTRSLGIPNTKEGHCGKTMAIIKYLNKIIENNDTIKWLAIVDDDTILSVARLQGFLSCFDPKEPLMIGERYGYNLLEEHGFNYITGGGGIVLSRYIVKFLSKTCQCPTNNTPDDMYLGLCLVSKLGYEVTHSTLFHQARPNDYAQDFLDLEPHISFHKHWLLDPVQVYEDWFSLADAMNNKSTDRKSVV